ncbi:MAG: LysR family transcriptional regulator [Parasphingorhabdus sp.]
MDWDLLSLRLFLRVAALRAIGKAGEEFGFSPATATQRLQALEASLGVSLLNRTTRSVTLTLDGERFLSHAKGIIDAVEEARLDISGGETRIKGLLRVTASSTFGHRYIAPHIAEFMADHPEAEVQLHLSDNVVDIVEQGFDLAIRVGALAPSSLRARKLAESPRALIASPRYLAEHGMPENLDDLKNHNCLLQGAGQNWLFQLSDKKQKKISVSGTFQSNSGEAIAMAAVDGLGIAIKSLWDVQDHLESGRLKILLPDHRILPDWDVWAVRPASPVLPARTKLFTGFLEEKFRTLPKRT